MAALVGDVRLTTKVSDGSTTLSPVTCTVTVCAAVDLAGNVTVPLAAV